MYAVFKRNFCAYFLNPTGYVFICVFVLLCSVAAFVPDNFINSNLANLAQLNLWFPLIALVFAPAVTMGVWTDERRFGSDELLTTQPLSSFQIVFGKYLASALVYTVSLVFSALANYVILDFLGNPDAGLFVTTYFGYWLVGLTATSLSMIVSYATSQLTVAYILGALIIAPLVALRWSDALPVSNDVARLLKSFSIDAFFEPFGRGVASLSGVLYFLSIPCLAIYICVVILSCRNWRARNATYRTCRYVFRAAALALLCASVVGIVKDHDLAFDGSAEKLSSLSPETLALVDKELSTHPIIIEARLSPEVPAEYAQTKINIISILNELKNRSKSQIFLDVREIQPNTQEAYRLERQYDVRPRKVVFDARGQIREDSIFLTIIFRCGSKTVTIPFMNRGLSVEYELVSSLLNVTSPPKKRVGILLTEAGALGRFDAYGRAIQQQWPLIDELSKQYVVESVDPSREIESGRYDALVAIQPSSLTPAETSNFINAVRRGQPTLVFEDPRPIFLDFLPGTLEKRTPTATNPIPPLKGEIDMLWVALGIRFNGGNVLWKNYNPYPKLATLSEEYLFVDARPIRFEGADDSNNQSNEGSRVDVKAFNADDQTVAQLEHILFPFVGSLAAAENAETKFVPLIRVDAGGYSPVSDVVLINKRPQCQKRIERNDVYTLAARIEGEVPKGFRIESDQSSSSSVPRYKVVVVADVDMATPGFFTLREMGADPRSGVSFDFDNISFILNTVDSLAGEDSLIAIRSRRPHHRTLERIEETTRKIRDQLTAAQIKYTKEFEEERRKEEAELQKLVREASSKNTNKAPDTLVQSAMVAAQERLKLKLDEKQRALDHKIEKERREVDEFTRKTRGRYKTYAALLPPTPPLIVGLFVYAYRRRRQGSAFGM